MSHCNYLPKSMEWPKRRNEGTASGSKHLGRHVEHYVGPQISGRCCGGVKSEDRLSLFCSLCSHSRC